MYVSNAYYDSRFNVTRILMSYNPHKNYSLTVTDINYRVLDYSIVLYDKCLKSESHFPLKYGNIIIQSNIIYDSILIHHDHLIHKATINANNRKQEYISNITWCLTSLRNFYDAPTQFNDTIKLAISYGIDRIILYYSDVSKRIMNLIRYYETLGYVESYYWLENVNICTMKICGKLLQLNDCFYKSFLNAKYIINVDIDEIIIPKFHINYLSLLKWYSIKYKNANMYIFYTKLCMKSEMIYHEERKKPYDYFNLPKVMDVSIYLIKNCCTVRVVRTACSKYIIKPSMIEALWLHDIWRGEYKYIITPINVAYTRHTRHMSYGLKKVCYNYSYEELHITL